MSISKISFELIFFPLCYCHFRSVSPMLDQKNTHTIVAIVIFKSNPINNHTGNLELVENVSLANGH